MHHKFKGWARKGRANFCSRGPTQGAECTGKRRQQDGKLFIGQYRRSEEGGQIIIALPAEDSRLTPVCENIRTKSPMRLQIPESPWRCARRSHKFRSQIRSQKFQKDILAPDRTLSTMRPRSQSVVKKFQKNPMKTQVFRFGSPRISPDLAWWVLLVLPLRCF